MIFSFRPRAQGITPGLFGVVFRAFTGGGSGGGGGVGRRIRHYASRLRRARRRR